jgi:iron complex outermembrane recepter protein
MQRILLLMIFLSSCLLINAQTDTLKYELDQVTVSATRYPEKIMEVPYAVSIISAKKLDLIRGYGLDEILNSIPGVLAQSRSGNQDIRIIIRGFGARGAGDRSNSGTSRGIRVMLDGFPETEPDGRTSFDNIDPANAGYIEVIRSNASALWGNAAGGVINLSSIPNFKKPFIRLDGSLGTFGYKRYSLQTASNIGNGKIFMSLSNNTFDGWRTHSSSSRTVLNMGITSMIGDRTNLGVYLVGSSNIFHIPGPLTLAEYNADPKLANGTYLGRDERRFNRLGRIGVSLDHGFNESNEISGMVYVNPKYLQRSERGTFRDFTRYHFGGNVVYKNLSHFSSDVKNTLIAGLDEAYQDGAILFYSLSATNGRGNTLKNNKREGANNFGAFVQNEINFNEKVSVIVGGRYDNVTYYSEDFLAPQFGKQQRSFTRFTPKAGITYRFSPVHSLYANLGGGVEVPAGNETDPAGTYGQDTVYLLSPLLEPINSTTIEVGTKQIISFEHKSAFRFINYELSLYYIKLINDIIPYRGGRFYFTAGKSHRIGAELSSTFQFDYGISLDAALTLSDNKYDEYKVDSAHYGVPGKFADYANNKTAGIPSLFYNVGLTIAPEALKGLFVSFGVNGTGSYFVNDANTIEVPSYNIFNAAIGLNKEIELGEHINMRGFLSINNIADTKYIGSAFVNPDIVGGVPVYLEPGLPRNVTVSLSFGIN